MSEEMLRQFLQRLNDDESFRETLRQDPEGVLAQFELSQTERTALGTGDEDALRRLCSMDVAGNIMASAACSNLAVCSAVCSLGCATTDRTQYTCEDVGCSRELLPRF
jgi:hypothetical protein